MRSFWFAVHQASPWRGARFFTDDAGLTTEGKCQLESWVQVNQNDTHDIWAVPACNPAGNLELSLGLNYFQIDQQQDIKSTLFQGKTLFKELDTNSWGLGFAAGVIRSAQDSNDADFAYFPLSISVLDDDLLLHLNLGWFRDRTTSSNRTTWGLGTAYALMPKISVFGEVFGDDRQKPLWHTGLDISLSPEFINLNITYGRNLAMERHDGFYSIGLNFYSIPW